MATAKEDGGSQFSQSLGSEEFYDLVCQPCKLDGKLQEAVGMCTDCQEYLCQRCFDGHTLPTPMRNHKLLDKKQMAQLHVSQKKEDKCLEKCAVHEDEVIKYYCIYHCQLGCSVCITLDHRSCENVSYIPHVAKDLANNEEYKKADSQLKEVTRRSKAITDKYKNKTESFEKDCSKAVKMVQDFRKEINETLDKIESDLVKSCKTRKAEKVKKMTQIVDKLATAQKDLELLQTMTETYKNNTQNCSLYIAMMKAKDKLTPVKERLAEAEKDQSSINSQLKFVPNKETLTILKSSESFGKLSESITTVDVKPEERATTDRQADSTTTVKRNEPRTIVAAHHVKDMNMQSSSDKRSCYITGLVVLSDNRILATDFKAPYLAIGNAIVKLVDIKKGQVITHLTLSSSPHDAAIVTSSQVAVTLPSDNKVAMVNVIGSALAVDRTLAVDGECRGVDYRDGKLAVTFIHPHKVQILTLDGRLLYTIANDKQGNDLFSSPQYVVFGHDNNSLYVSNSGSNSVLHMEYDGTVVGRYINKALKCPAAFFSDSCGNVYICGELSNNIHIITPDRKIQILLTKADGLISPRSISYNEAECTLYVGGLRNNVIQKYKVTLSSK